MPQNDFWLGALEEKPEMAYFGYQDKWRSPNKRKWYESQFQDVQNQYMGRLGQQIMGGGEPTLKFADFLKDWFAPQGGEEQQWAGMSPWARGEQTTRFAPPVRWLPYGRNSGFGGF